MSYTPTEIVPKLKLFQWNRPEAPNPRINTPISFDDTTLGITNPPLDKDGAVIPGDFLMNIKNEEGYVENMFVPRGFLEYDGQGSNFTVGERVTGGTSGATGYILSDDDSGTTGTLTLFAVTGTFQNNETITSAGGSATVNGVLTDNVSADGQTISFVVRGVRLNGLDYTTSDTDLIGEHGVNSPVGCVISPVHYQILFDWIQGASSIASHGNLLRIGRYRAEDISIQFGNDHTVEPNITFDDGNGYFVNHWGDNQPSGGTYILGGVFDDLTEANTYPWPDHGVIITAGGVTYFREGGAWVANQAGGSVADASEVGAGKVEEATQTENNNGASIGATLAKIFATPAKNAKTIQEAKWVQFADASGSDAYTGGLTPAISGYVDKMIVYGELSTPNNGASTLNLDGKGARHIKVRNYEATITGDFVKGYRGIWQMVFRTVTFNAGFSGGETAGTLTGNWAYATGIYTVVFSNGDEREVTLTNGNTSATWAGALSGVATANATAQYWQTLSALAQTIATSVISSKANKGNSGSNLHTPGSNANFALAHNIDIDVSPFGSSDVIEVEFTVHIDYDSTNTVEYNKVFKSFKGIMGGAGKCWGSKSTSDGGGSSLSPFIYNGDQSLGDANNDATNLTTQLSLTPGAENGSVTVAWPVWSGSNLRFATAHTGNDGVGISLRPTVYVTILAIKRA